MEYGILSIVPTIVAVGLALTTKNVYVSLLLGLFIGNVIIFDGNILSGVDGIICRNGLCRWKQSDDDAGDFSDGRHDSADSESRRRQRFYRLSDSKDISDQIKEIR